MSIKPLVVDYTDPGNAFIKSIAQQTTIADLTAITGGESPTEAEHNLVVAKVNAILAVLDAAGITA